jgi:serine protease Do
MSTAPKRLRIPAFAAMASIVILSACSALPQSRLQVNLNEPKAPVIANTVLEQQNKQAPKPQAPASSTPQSDVVAAYQGTLEDLYQRVGPSVVNIQVVEGATSGQSQVDPFGGQGQGSPQVQRALGSGFVWDQQGHIVTNNHVAGTASKIEVTFSDGTTLPAKLVGADPDSDLAVIQVSGANDLLKPVEMADSSQVKVGQLAIAIGNPFGLSGTMTTGIVSAMERSLPAQENAQGSSYTIPDIIQTDAAINPGNSGGVLINEQGQVIGVTAAIESPSGSNAGIGFAIPSSIVQRVIPALIKDGKYAHSWLGISAGSLVPALATAMNLPANTRGALIGEVTSGSPAEKAGLIGSTKTTTIDGQQASVGGDVITAIDGQPVKGINDVIAYLTSSTSVGQKVTLTLLRNGQQMTVDVVLASRPAQAPVAAQGQQQPQLPNNPSNPGDQGNGIPRIPNTPSNPSTPNTPRSGSAFLGVSSVTVTPEIAQAMNLPENTTGALVVEVQTGSPAEQAGLQAGNNSTQIQGQTITLGGDVITAVDGQSVTSVQGLRVALGQHKPGDSVTLSVIRGGDTAEVSVTLGTRSN